MYDISLQKIYYTILSFSSKNYSNHSLRCLLVGPTSQVHLSFKGNSADVLSPIWNTYNVLNFLLFLNSMTGTTPFVVCIQLFSIPLPSLQTWTGIINNADHTNGADQRSTFPVCQVVTATTSQHSTTIHILWSVVKLRHCRLHG